MELSFCQEALKPNMENLRNRFPTLISRILDNVDDESLVIFKETNREIHDFLDKERFYWIRILRRYNGSFVEFWDSWKMVIVRNPVEMVREIAMIVEEFFRFPVPDVGKRRVPRNTRQWAPLHIAAAQGNLSIFKYIFHKTNNEYPIGVTTALHLAAQAGHLEVCQYIVNNTSADKSITDLHGESPIHGAADEGQLEVCNFLIENFDLENCKGNYGITPLYLAAAEGHLEMCKLLIGKMQEKNPEDDYGQTALHVAAGHGHLEVCKLLIKELGNINPRNGNGWTPLHLAAASGHGEVCKLIAGYLGNKNPVSNEGVTPRQLMMKFARDLFSN